MNIDHIQSQYPFLTLLRHKENEHVAIVQNCDDKFVSFYDYGALSNREDQELFLEFGDIWWSESNRIIPINIFLRGQMEMFRYALRTANVRDVTVMFGPVTSLGNVINRRIKRRQIQLVRRIE